MDKTWQMFLQIRVHNGFWALNSSRQWISRGLPGPGVVQSNCQHYARDLVHFLQDSTSAELLCKDREARLKPPGPL